MKPVGGLKLAYDKILETSLKLIESLPKISAYFEYDEIGILKFEKDSNNPTNISITIVNDSNLNIESKFFNFFTICDNGKSQKDST